LSGGSRKPCVLLSAPIGCPMVAPAIES
jgi:hypothetical protein